MPTSAAGSSGDGYHLFSGTLFAVAMEVRHRALAYSPLPDKRGENERLRWLRQHADDGLIGIVFAALSVEAFFNEVPILLTRTESSDPRVAKLLADIDSRSRSSTQERVDLAAVAFSGTHLDHGRAPYQDFATLFDVRDAIVHMKPQRVVMRSESGTGRGLHAEHKVLDTQIRKWCTESPGHPLIYRIATRGVVDWAVRSAVAIVDSVLDMLPQETRYMFNGVRMQFHRGD